MSDELTREQEIAARARLVTSSIAQMMAAASGDGACEVCGVAVPLRTIGNRTLYARQCSACVEAERAREIDEHVAACLEQWRRSAGITQAQIADVLMHELHMPEQWASVRAGELPCAAYLRGPTGTGKTTLGIAWLRGLAERAIRRAAGDGSHLRKWAPRTCYAREDALAIELGDRDGRGEVMRRWIAADMVFLDDLGSAPPPPFMEDYIAHILMERHAARKLTLLASNHRLVDLLNSQSHPHITDRLVMRLAEMTAKGATLHTMEHPWRAERMSELNDELMDELRRSGL